jgi:hypothetical protein
MKTFLTILRPLLMIPILATAPVLQAQQDLTLYPMQSIPQSNYNNPALMPDCKFYIGCLPVCPVPVMPSIYASFSNSGFTYGDLIHKSGDGTLKFDATDAISNMSPRNYFSMNMNLELLSFGFKIKEKHYVSLGIYEKQGYRFCYPKDLLSTLWNGNYQYAGSTATLDGFGIDWNQYSELAVGYTYAAEEKWSMGGRLKVLFGMSNIWTKKTKASYSVDENNYYITSKTGMQVNVALEEDLMRRIESYNNDTSGNAKLDMNGYDPLDYAMNTKNMGCALDLGFNYNISPKFSVALSALDLGFINWKSGARTYKSPDTSYTFRGFDLAAFIRSDPSESSADVFKKMIDSIANVFQLNTSKESYRTYLNPVFYVSGFYTPTIKDKISLLTRLDIYKGNVHPAFSLGYYHKIKNAASICITYSYLNRDWLNVGIGAAFKMGPFQYFITTDNILAAIIPYKAKNINLHVGCNMVFFYKKNSPLNKKGGDKSSAEQTTEPETSE